MADYKAIYDSKLTTAEEVAKRVQSGWTLGMDAGPTHANGIGDRCQDALQHKDCRKHKGTHKHIRRMFHIYNIVFIIIRTGTKKYVKRRVCLLRF